MKSLLDKHLNLQPLSFLQLQQIAYLTGLSMENISFEMNLGNFLLSQIENGKWIFICEDKVGTEISYREFYRFMVLKILNGISSANQTFTPESQNDEKPIVGLKKRMDPENNPDLVLSYKYHLEKFLQQVQELKEKRGCSSLEAAAHLIYEMDMAKISEYNDRVHTLHFERASGKQVKNDGVIKLIKGNGLEPGGYIVDEIRDINPKLENSEKVIRNSGCPGIPPEKMVILQCAGMEDYNAGKALQDALLEASRCLSVAMNDFGETTTTAVDSVERISEMMNILKKQEPVDQYPRKHLSPKEFGMSLKRNQRRHG